MDPKYTCCVFGHRNIEKSESLRARLYCVMEELIRKERVETFLFGSKSAFNDLCHAVATELKEKYPHLKRIYVRAEYPHISEQYQDYLLGLYEDTYYPEKILASGKAVYIERNYEMIHQSRFCIVYYDEKKTAVEGKSGTKIALEYAIKNGKRLILLPSL